MRDPSITRFPSPLRYPGGKGKIANFIKLVLLKNQLVGKEYIEPFAGGASVALILLYEEYASHIHINDLNRSVHAFWSAVLQDTDDLCRRVRDTRLTMREWHRQRAVQDDPDAAPLDLGFSTFFLNRTNRSGIIRGGIIGGQGQTGTWKLDARYNAAALVRRIEKVARHRNRITLTQRNGADFLRTVIPRLPNDAFVFLDPPYYAKGEGLYENAYVHHDHVEVAALVARMSQTWLVSYDAVPQVTRLYSGYRRLLYTLSYSAGDRYRGREVMFFAPQLRRPSVRSPANIFGDSVEKLRLSLARRHRAA